MIPLPGWIDREAWDGFVEMRRLMPKTRPFTVRAATLILFELQRIKDAGHDANAALDQSTLRGWADVYAPADKPIATTAQKAAERRDQQTVELLKRDQMTPEQKESADRARAEAMAKISRIRRVA